MFLSLNISYKIQMNFETEVDFVVSIEILI